MSSTTEGSVSERNRTTASISIGFWKTASTSPRSPSATSEFQPVRSAILACGLRSRIGACG